MTAVHEKLVMRAPGLRSEKTRQARIAQCDAPGVERLRVDGKFLARGKLRFRAGGVTYGPFAANRAGEPFPEPVRVRDDFARMAAAGINAVRTYHVPPEWFLVQADEAGVAVFVDVPWPKHLCFLDSRMAMEDARKLVRHAAKRCATHPCLLAYSIGNEVPPDVVRWHGSRQVERFLAELRDVVKQADPSGLVTYANYPPTEYLDLSFLDFATFNVYLHDPDAFRRYLIRIQNLVGDRPLLLGEVGMDSLRHGEQEQARFLAGHLREITLAGLAGAFVFSWTDEWHTGGHPIRDWEFGVTHADRAPKAALHAISEVYGRSPSTLLTTTPRVSVVVCSYNGGRTLDQCLRSLLVLDYPDYEVIVVDDGSTDDTRAILARYPEVRAVHQPNLGLSEARNSGLRATTASIIAYTDSDCFADRDWLTQLVHRFELCDAAAVGGPNLTPEDGRLAGCVAAAPGQPTHVLESDQVAEHIPGCNMAFRRDALLAINGFDPVFRMAGDDVDVCWRLHQAGLWIAFAPGAFVWHHRRQNPRAYLRQQAGYGEAEALLRFKHPDKFNGRGDGKWRGVLYGPSLRGLCLSDALIYRGTYAAGLFQCLYQPVAAHWAMLPATLEWHLCAFFFGAAALLWPALWVAAAAALGLSVGVAILQAAQASLSPKHERLSSRLLIAGLCYFQPLVRSWCRYRTRFFRGCPLVIPALPAGPAGRLPLHGVFAAAYWSESGVGRLQLLDRTVLYLNEHRWGKVIDGGWSDWDLRIYCQSWTVLEVCTAQEDHGGQKTLVRVRYRLRPGGYLKALVFASLCGVTAGVVIPSGLVAVSALSLLALCAALWVSGTYRASRAAAVLNDVASEIGFVPGNAGPQAPGINAASALGAAPSE